MSQCFKNHCHYVVYMYEDFCNNGKLFLLTSSHWIALQHMNSNLGLQQHSWPTIQLPCSTGSKF